MLTGAQAAAHPVRPKTYKNHINIIISYLLPVLSSSSSSTSSSTTTTTTTRFLIVNIIVVAFSLCFCGAQLNINEAEALIKFKSSLINADPALADWKPSSPPCSKIGGGHWVGVLCTNNGNVYGLQLEKMGLKGKIDVDSLAPLPYLRTISFMGNSFEGPMPDWKKIGALKALFLSNNQFSGDIPGDAFKGMTSLKKVYLSNNKFTGHIPTSLESPKLIELKLENNQFTGTIPAISSDNLKLLNLSHNQLEGPIPGPLLKMDPSGFSGNKELCGKPAVESDCNAPPDDAEPSADKSKSSSTATIAIIVASVVVGLFVLILLFVLISRKNRGTQPPAFAGTVDGRGTDAAAAGAATATQVVSREAAPIPTPTPTPSPPTTTRKSEPQSGKLSFVREDRAKFDLQDLMRASAEVLGSGNFGASYKAVLVEGEAVVVKRFKQMNSVGREDFHEHMRRLGRLSHPNLLPLVAYLYRKDEKLFVLDYVHNGSLAARLHSKHSAEKPGLNWPSRLKIIKGVTKGVVYLHNELPSLSVPHGHLKSSNVLLDKDLNPLLMDYTLAPVVNASQVHQILVAFKSPEYAQHGRTTKKTDVWCLGVLILEILTGKFLAQGSTADLTAWINAIVGEDRSKVLDKEMEIGKESCRPEIDKLLQIGIACCQEDQEKRWDLEEAVHKIEQVQECAQD
ncbi:Pollen receptor-like kinase [Sesamum alatum]|uniref:Pollen receptor-like kinase n=1 Tax=Sesamum alatum TaxID=300844 RepID=A0AAE2CME0_9LAMI|nr:Pollen receptor-like kinase [Sesamum alatum]